MGQALRKVTGGGSKLGPSSKLRGRGEMPMESRFSDDPHFNRHLPGDVHPGPPPPPPNLNMGSPDDREWNKSDPMYSAMVKELAGSVVAKQDRTGMNEDHPQFRRPLPKSRQSKGSTPTEHNNVPPGKLNAGHIRQIFLSYQGLLEGEKAMDVKGLAKKYNVDAALLEKVLKFSSIPNPDERNEFKGVTHESTKPRLE